MAAIFCRRLGGGSGDAFHDTRPSSYGTGISADELGGRPRRQVEIARAVIVDDNQRRSAALAAALKLGGGDLAVIVVAPDDPALRSELLPADLVLLALGGREVSALGIGAEAVQRNPFTEVVFYCDDPDAPEVSAASVLGITRIVPAQHMPAWLARGGNLLARGACLRRAAAACAAAVPRPPTLAAVTRRPVAAAAADGRDAVPRELHPLPARRERQPARGGEARRRPVPHDVRDDPQARHRHGVARLTLQFPVDFPSSPSSPSASSQSARGREKKTRAGAGCFRLLLEAVETQAASAAGSASAAMSRFESSVSQRSM